MTSRPSVFGAKPLGARLERMRASPRYRDGGFHNTAPVGPGLQSGSVVSTMSEYLFGGQRRTPPGPLPLLSPLERWARPVETGLRVTWLGHSTLLLEIDGFRVLTDPVFGERAAPTAHAGPRRFHPTPVTLDQLPPLDLVLVSHDHYDHLCFPTIQQLARKGVPFVTSLGVGAHLEAWGVAPERITELDWWEQVRPPGTGLAVHAVPSQHFSGRSVGDRNRTLWSSWVIQTDHHKVFFSGDTGLTEEYAEVGRRLGPFDLVMLEVGAFHPAWGTIHLGPENALKAHALLGGGPLLPVHWGTFNLAIHAWDEPAETLVRLADQQGVRLITPRLGGVVEPSRFERIDPWWREVGAPSAVAEPRPSAEGA